MIMMMQLNQSDGHQEWISMVSNNDDDDDDDGDGDGDDNNDATSELTHQSDGLRIS